MSRTELAPGVDARDDIACDPPPAMAKDNLCFFSWMMDLTRDSMEFLELILTLESVSALRLVVVVAVVALLTLRELVARLIRFAACILACDMKSDDESREDEGEGLNNFDAKNDDDDKNESLGIFVNKEGFPVLVIAVPVVTVVVLLVPLLKLKQDTNVGRKIMCRTRRRNFAKFITPKFVPGLSPNQITAV